jgi:hypothetical protein
MRLAMMFVVLTSVFAIGCQCDCEDTTPVNPTGSLPSATPAPTPTPVSESAAVPTPTADPTTPMFTLCRAMPPVIDKGDSFEIRYAVTYGKVRLARKDEEAFVMGLPSAGLYTLKAGDAGYPLGTGVQKYRCISAVNRLVREKTSIEVRP